MTSCSWAAMGRRITPGVELHDHIAECLESCTESCPPPRCSESSPRVQPTQCPGHIYSVAEHRDLTAPRWLVLSSPLLQHPVYRLHVPHFFSIPPLNRYNIICDLPNFPLCEFAELDGWPLHMPNYYF